METSPGSNPFQFQNLIKPLDIEVKLITLTSFPDTFDPVEPGIKVSATAYRMVDQQISQQIKGKSYAVHFQGQEIVEVTWRVVKGASEYSAWTHWINPNGTDQHLEIIQRERATGYVVCRRQYRCNPSMTISENFPCETDQCLLTWIVFYSAMQEKDFSF